jgi:hypothetical protein
VSRRRLSRFERLHYAVRICRQLTIAASPAARARTLPRVCPCENVCGRAPTDPSAISTSSLLSRSQCSHPNTHINNKTGIGTPRNQRTAARPIHSSSWKHFGIITHDPHAGSLPTDSGYPCHSKCTYIWVAVAIFPFTLAPPSPDER